jgi:hypothetical protein
MPIRVLGIDPSNKEHNGAVLLTIEDGRLVISRKCLVGGEDVVQLLKQELGDSSQSVPLTIFCEDISNMGFAVGSDVFETCFWIGEYRRVAKELDADFRLVKRNTIKIHHCQSSRAKDPNIRARLIERFGYYGSGKTGLGTKADPGMLYGIKGDMWSALAIAVYGAEQLCGEGLAGAREVPDQPE